MFSEIVLASEYRAIHKTVITALRENHASRNLIDGREARGTGSEGAIFNVTPSFGI